MIRNEVNVMSENTTYVLAAGLLLAGLSATAHAAEGCWLDVYDKPDFGGNHVRIEGPVELASLAKLNNENWDNRIESLIVGPKAHVKIYRNESYKEKTEGPVYHGEALKAWGETPESYSDQELSLGEDRKEHHLGEEGFHQAINSLKIKCMP